MHISVKPNLIQRILESFIQQKSNVFKYKIILLIYLFNMRIFTHIIIYTK